MRYALSVLVLLALLPVGLAQDNEAEKLFSNMEKKIKAANAVQVAVDIEIRAIKGRERESKLKDKVSRANGFLLLTKDNKARLKISGEYVGMEMVSNGKQIKLATDEGENRSIDEAEAQTTPKKFHGLLSTLVSRDGVAATAMSMPFCLKYGVGEIEINPDDEKNKLRDFKAGAAEKVGGRDARVVSFKYGKGDKDALPVTVWIDAKTLLPLKHVIVIGMQNMHITEIYTDFKLAPKLDAKAFELISAPGNEAEKLFRAVEERIKAAKAVQFTFDMEMREKDKEGKSKGSLLFTKDNKARLKMSGDVTGKPLTIEMISDGKQMKMVESPETIAKADEQPTPTNLHSRLSAIVSGPGLLLNLPNDPMFRLTYFKAGAAAKVGGRDAKVVMFLMDTAQVTLWIDAETMLPLKRLIVVEGNGGGRITEMCNFNLNPKVDAGAFALPK